MNFFDISNDLCASKDYNWSEEFESEYDQFMINRSISNYYDTIMFSNEMNLTSGLTNKQQYDFYKFSIHPKKKRFAKWAKPDKDERVKIVSDYYKCSKIVAEQYSKFITDGDISKMREIMCKGGRK